MNTDPDWLDVIAILAGVAAVVAGVLVWFGPGPALVGGGLLLLVVHWSLTDNKPPR